MQSFLQRITILLAMGIAGITAFGDASTAQENFVGQRTADFQEQLELGLKARRDGEFVFISRVVLRVQQRHFSEGEVKSVFQWARRKNTHAPFPYFERAMRILAARKNVNL